MKKQLTIIAAVCAGLVSQAVFAANVQMYGRVDNGLYFTNTKVNGKTENSFTMESGMGGASRWGIRADSDEFAPGWKVSVKLEGKFLSDTGELGTSSTIFDRESSIIVSSPYGALQFGRIGYLHGGVSGGMIAGQTNPFGVIYKQCGAQNVFMNATTRTPNTIRYETPKFNGFYLATQWCNSANSDEENNALPDRKRYFGIGAGYKNGPFRVAAVYGAIYYSNMEKKEKQAVDSDEHSYSIAANYNFGSAKVFGGYQYGENLGTGTKIMGKTFLGAKTHNAIVGVSVPVGGGTLMAATALTQTKDGKALGTKAKFIKQDGCQCAVGYKYNLSKRTVLYTAASYRYLKGTKNNQTRSIEKTKTLAVMAGLGVNF